MLALTQGTYSGLVTSTQSANGLLTCVTTYQPKDFNNAPHYHANTHFSFTLEGGCVERKKERYEICAGDLTFYSAGELHQVERIVKPCRRINVEIEPHFFDQYGLTESKARLAIASNADAKFRLLAVYNELLTRDSFSGAAIQMLLIQLISRDRQRPANATPPSWVGRITAFLHENWSEPITLHDLSLVADLHPVTLSKQFPTYFACTLGEYKRKLRIEKALSLLKSSSLSLTDVALACGFFDQSHFIRTFKELTDLRPLQYKKL